MTTSTYQPKILHRTQFGNPILHKVAKRLTVAEIKSKEIQHLIADITYTLEAKKLGVGLAAPQVGKSIALSVIKIRPVSYRADLPAFEQVIINPEIVKTFGVAEPMWEGCLSMGTKNSPMFAQALRYKKVEVKFYDESGALQQTVLKGLPAHVFQHETDHLNGILFPERVADHKTWMNFAEYKKLRTSEKKQRKSA